MRYCDPCDRWFQNEDALQRHLQHSKQHDYCLRCDRAFKCTYAKDQHIKDSARHNVCTFCSQHPDFDTRNRLKKHVEEEHNGCFECWLKFSNHESLVQHDVDVHGFCKACAKFFKFPSNLKIVRLMYQDEMVVFLWDEFETFVTTSSIGRALKSNG
ncbi:hypothetical protein BX600DRAFT_469927 [Xylariales sp. PMI_506]|nr:hypothetical protein BX600DRAFT_469927 [Xylariales sp. PMI_506]